MSAFLLSLLQAEAPLVGAAIIGLLGKGVQYVANLVNHSRIRVVQTNAQSIDSMLQTLQGIMKQVVLYYEQVVVAPAKANGTWNAQLAATVKQQALDRFAAVVPESLMTAMRHTMPNVGGVLETLLEAALPAVKQEFGMALMPQGSVTAGGTDPEGNPVGKTEGA